VRCITPSVRLRVEESGSISVGVMLCLELTQRGAKPAGSSGSRIAVNETAKLAHGAARIVEAMLVEVHEGQSHTKVIATGELLRTERIKLDGRRSGIVERAGQQRGAPQRGLDPVSGISGSLGIRRGGSLMLPSHLECFNAGVPAPHPHQTDIDEEVKQSVDHRLEHTGQEPNSQTVHRPERNHQLEHAGIAGDDGKHNRQYGTEQRDGTDGHSNQTEGLFSPGLTRAGFPGCSFDHGLKVGRLRDKFREPRLGQQAVGRRWSVDFRSVPRLNPSALVRSPHQ
jgi:hypothetical protein